MASDIGHALRDARLARGMELEEAERATKIRSRYLQALEEERWEVLPGPSYVRGFLRTYAHYLGLDGDALVAEYREAHREEEAPGPIPSDMLPRRGQIKRRGQVRQRGTRKSGRGTGPPRPGRKGLAALALVAVAGVVAFALLGGDGGESGAGAFDPDSRDLSDVEPASTEEGSGPSGGGPEGVEGNESKDSGKKRDSDGKTEVSLAATGTVWVCLTSGGGKVLVPGETLAAGDERGPFRGGAFEVTMGNGSVEMELDGRPVEVPQRAEPQGYRINEDGTRELAEADRPTCA